MDDITVSIDTRELEEALKALPDRVAKNMLKTALVAGAEVIQSSMVEHAPQRTDEPTPAGDSLPPGILKADIQIEVQMDERGGHVKIGPTSIAGHVARWIQNGWALTTHGRKGKRKVIREIPANPFVTRAFDESAENAVKVMLDKLSDSLGGD